MTSSPPPQEPEHRPGELEWRLWLEDRGHLDAAGWVTSLSQETARLAASDGPGPVVRLLEQAVNPVSPVFDALTGPRARELATRLEELWRGVESGVPNQAVPWRWRYRELDAVLRRWVRYRRNRRLEQAEAGESPPRKERPSDQIEAYYQNWVLIPLRENFLRVLEDRGVTRRTFCSQLGMSEAYLSQILNGKRNPSLHKLAEISHALRVDLGRLFAVRAHRGGSLPWGPGPQSPEPGDTGTWHPGKISRPYAALEAHYRLVFYPGPDLPGEKIVARSHLIVDPEPSELVYTERYALQDENDLVVVGSYAGPASAGKRHRFIAAGDGRVLEVASGGAARPAGKSPKGEASVLGRVAGTLVEFGS